MSIGVREKGGSSLIGWWGLSDVYRILVLLYEDGSCGRKYGEVWNRKGKRERGRYWWVLGSLVDNSYFDSSEK